MKRVENNVAKEEIVQNEQFLILLQCFQKSSGAGVSERVCMSERVMSPLETTENKCTVCLKHCVGAKGEIAHNVQFPLWPQCFQLYLTIKLLWRFFTFLSQCFQSCLLQICLYVGKG